MRLDQRKIGIGRGVYLGWKFVGADTVYDCVSECLVCPEMHSQKIVVTFASWKLILLCTCLLAEAFLTLGRYDLHMVGAAAERQLLAA